jgi:hypothetical protein
MKMDTEKKYKIRQLNVLDIRTIAKILKEVGITRNEMKETIQKIFSTSKSIADGNKGIEVNIDLETNIETVTDTNTINYIGQLLPLLDIVLDILVESETFWTFLSSILGIKNLAIVPMYEVKNIINTLVKDESVTSFFTGASTQEPNLAK